ncbi:MAG: stalk domain-containing protein [Thermacetogeniaceae bacterium]
MKSWMLIVIAVMLLLLVPGMPLLAQAEALQLSEADNNRTITVDLGQTLELSLPSNPNSTGYDWSYAGSLDQDILVEVSHSYTSASTTSHVIGAGGINHWVFKTVGTGTAQLNLVYARSWESVQPAKTYTVGIKVNLAPAPGPSQSSHASFVVGSKTYLVDGQAYQMDVAPFAAGGRVYVPVRYLVQAFGLDAAGISWNASSQTVVLPPNQKGTAYRLQIGNKNIYQIESGGSASVVETMDAAPVIRDGRAYLPARYIAELFGYQVSWDAASGAVLIDSPVK